MKDYIITIGREFGSHGHSIGEKLAQRMGISFYDKAIVTEAAKKSGYDEEIFEKADEKRTVSLLFSIAMNVFPYSSKMEHIENASFEDKLYVIQKNIILDLVSKGPCIIVGRCSNYILKNAHKGFHFFIYSSPEKRCKDICLKYNLEELQGKELMNKMDKKRSNYYNYYTGNKWGDRKNYDLLLNSATTGIDGAVDLLESYVKINLSE